MNQHHNSELKFTRTKRIFYLLLISASINQHAFAQSQANGDVSWEPPIYQIRHEVHPGYPSFGNQEHAGQYCTNSCNTAGLQNSILVDTNFSTQVLDFQNRQTDKQLMLLEHGYGTSTPQLIVGGQLRGSFLAATTNSANRFSYLGRFPPDFVGTSATDARLLHGNLSAAGHFGPWAHGYFETLFSDVFTFPTFEQGSFQVRQAYLAIGNLNASPFYMFLGKKNVGFGDMGTLSPFSQAMNWHYFAPLAEGIGAGYYKNGVNFNVTALNGGRGIRVADSSRIGSLNNFAANGSVDYFLGNACAVQFGAGYLHGTIYDSLVAEHTNRNQFGQRNGAWDVNAQVRLGQLHLAAELTRTLDPWPATGEHVTAYRTEFGFDHRLMGKFATTNVSWSEGIQGPNGSEFEFNRQLVVGSSIRFSPNALFTMEYVNSQGFAPLIDIQTVSNRDVQQHSAVLGIVLSL